MASPPCVPTCQHPALALDGFRASTDDGQSGWVDGAHIFWASFAEAEFDAFSRSCVLGRLFGFTCAELGGWLPGGKCFGECFHCHGALYHSSTIRRRGTTAKAMPSGIDGFSPSTLFLPSAGGPFLPGPGRLILCLPVEEISEEKAIVFLHPPPGRASPSGRDGFSSRQSRRRVPAELGQGRSKDRRIAIIRPAIRSWTARDDLFRAPSPPMSFSAVPIEQVHAKIYWANESRHGS